MAASSVSDYPQLQKIITPSQRIVYLCGTGVSMSLGTHGLSWVNWISAGKEYLDKEDQEILDNKLGSWKTDELIGAATFLLEKTKVNNNYVSFMNKTVGSLHPSNQSYSDTFRRIWRSGDLIATTNYDLIIEEALNSSYVTYSKSADVLSVIKGNENKVIHLHGVYDSLHGTDDIVADESQYKKIIENEGAQFIQNLIGTYPLVIVGCGGTVEDPNLSSFMNFIIEKLGVTSVPYFYLLKKGDSVPNLPSNAMPVFYGEQYNDLVDFLTEISVLRLRNRAGLKRLVSVNPYIEHPLATSAFGRMHFSNGFNEFVGREEEINKLNQFLEKDNQLSWWSVLGEGGIGKSRLILEWLRKMPYNWFGYFSHKNPEEASKFTPFTDSVIVFDYILGNEEKCANTISAYIDVFKDTRYKLRVIIVERNQGLNASDWLKKTVRGMDSSHRVVFEAGKYGEPIVLSELSANEEVDYIDRYLQRYLPLLPTTDFIQNCKSDIIKTSQTIEDEFRSIMIPSCYRPLYLSIYTEVWVHKEGSLTFESIEDLLSEYLNKEEERWKLILQDDTLVDSYLRLLAIACAIEHFNITDVYGDNYLEDDAKKLIEYLDTKSGKPGADNVFEDLFISMDELEEDDEDDLIATTIFKLNQETFESDSNDTGIITWDEDERFAFFTPYIKLSADPTEVYLQMLANANIAEDDELEELKRIREERIKHVESLPDHAWIIEPVLPDIIKEFIVSYVVNDRDIASFTKLARSNSILGLSEFLVRALEDWKEKTIFQKMAVIPPDEMLNYFEYYISIMIRIEAVNDISAVEQALIESDPLFSKFEMELWRRIAVVLTDRGEVKRLYDSGCRFLDYINSIESIVSIRDEVADVVEAYSVGLYNADMPDSFGDYLSKCDKLIEIVPDNILLGEVMCANYRRLMHLRLYHSINANIFLEWAKIQEYIERYNCQETMCRDSMESAHELMMALCRNQDLNKLRLLETSLENIFAKRNMVETAEIAALCSANIFSITYMKTQAVVHEEYEKVKNYYNEYPYSKHIMAAYLSTSKEMFLSSSSYKKVPDKLLEDAKMWALQYPEDIEFPEGYFGLLLAQLEYAQAHDMINEQQRIFKEMKAVAERTDYSEYQESNDMFATVRMLQILYGYY